jgi:hypothetical protein
MKDVATREVARLLYHCGVSVHMNYSPSFSGSSSYDAGLALINHFNYSDKIQFIRHTYDIPHEVWDSIFRNELDQARPIIGGLDPPRYGKDHAYVVDGYYGEKMFHYNWGWGGSSDGYFLLGVPIALVGIQPEHCESDTIKLGPVGDISYRINEETVFLSWVKPDSAADGDIAYRYKVMLDESVETYRYDTNFKFGWTQYATHQFKIRSYDKCLNSSDSLAVVKFTIPDTINRKPKLGHFDPLTNDTIPVYPGVYKIFNLEVSDPDGDEITYSWRIHDQVIKDYSSPTLSVNFRDLTPGVFPVSVTYSDHQFAFEHTWMVRRMEDDLAIIDDVDSVRWTGIWYSDLRYSAIGNHLKTINRVGYTPPCAEYLYQNQLIGIFEVTVNIPQLRIKTTMLRDYIVTIDGNPTDTFRLNANTGFTGWYHLGYLDLDSVHEVTLRGTMLDYVRSDSMLATDAIRFTYLGQSYDYTPPLLHIDTIVDHDVVKLTATEDGVVYLVQGETCQTLAEIRKICIDSIAVTAGIRHSMSLKEIGNGIFQLYARDENGNLSVPEEFTVLSIGLKDPVGKKALVVYPNPTGNILYFRMAEPGNFRVEIISPGGRVLRRMQCPGNSARMDVTGLARGVYLLRVTSPGMQSIRKIIIH